MPIVNRQSPIAISNRQSPVQFQISNLQSPIASLLSVSPSITSCDSSSGNTPLSVSPSITNCDSLSRPTSIRSWIRICFRRYLTVNRRVATTQLQSLLMKISMLSRRIDYSVWKHYHVTNALLSNHLPPKIVEVVCCKLTPLQTALYTHFIHSKNVKKAIVEDVKQTKILAYITALKKLCNHPKLIYDTMKSGKPGTAGSGSWTGGDGSWVELSGKMQVLARLLAHLRKKTDDRIVLVSNYTQTLDLIVQLCRERRYPFLRLDGSTSISKRQKLVNCFNDQSKDEFAFLLSSKAGGCGLNLIGGNRLVLFDPDWNPANDKQAAARVWRDGQKKRVYIYRFLSTGTIE
ncbi:hypothetical protein LXL04_022644 [Taraxacum kok-saghyz]